MHFCVDELRILLTFIDSIQIWSSFALKWIVAQGKKVRLHPNQRNQT